MSPELRGNLSNKLIGHSNLTERPSWLSARGFGTYSTIICGFLALAATAWWLYEPNASYMALGWAAGFVVSFPFLAQRSSFHSPWALVAITVYLGCGIRGTFIALGVEGPDNTLNDLFLLGKPPGYFVAPSLLHLGGLIALTAGYMGVASHQPKGSQNAADTRPQRQFKLGRHTPGVAIVMAAIGFGALVMYAGATGGFSLESISAKRTTINGLNLADDYASHGGLRFLSGFSSAAFWLMIAHVANLKRLGSRVGLGWMLVFLLGVNAILFPFYTSARSDAGLTVIVGIALYLALGGNVSRRAVFVGAAVLVVLVPAMTFLRLTGGGLNATSGISAMDSILNSTVYNRNFGDMENTSHIVRNVPEVIPFQDGETMVGYLVGPVPRSIWPDKPIVNAGPMIGVYIYGNSRSGVPPGLFGDFYLNFGGPAVIFGSLFTGLALGGVERWRRGLHLGNIVPVIIYCTIGMRLGMFAINKGMAFAVFKGAIELVPVLIALYLAVVSYSKERQAA